MNDFHTEKQKLLTNSISVINCLEDQLSNLLAKKRK